MSVVLAAPGVAGGVNLQFARDVAQALSRTPRELPSQYLYDALGSALFEAICCLPWYKITRAEKRLLEGFGGEILAAAGALGDVVELGPGSGEKLALLLRARPVVAPLRVHLVDVSKVALAGAAELLGRLDGVTVQTHEALYEDGLAAACARRDPVGRTLALLLGSNIGNFGSGASRALLAHLHATLQPGDRLLLGTDLVKPEADLLLAYDDPLEVTAAFNRNLLVRLNRELGANFDLEGFDHQACWDGAAGRVEMHLVSTRAQRVQVPGSGLDFELGAGETIWTESSYKYTLDQVDELLVAAGFAPQQVWVDAEAQFALTLASRTRGAGPDHELA